MFELNAKAIQMTKNNFDSMSDADFMQLVANKCRNTINNTEAGKYINELIKRLATARSQVDELGKENRDLRKQLSAAMRHGPILRECKSCFGYYPDGYLCSCGRDNSYSDAEWQAELKRRERMEH